MPLFAIWEKNVNDFYSDIIIFTNLRGDATKHNKQTDFMQRISFMSFILLQENDLDEAAFELLEKLAKSEGGVILMFADLRNNQNIKNQKKKERINGMSMIKLKGRNFAQIRNEVRKEIVQKLKSGKQKDHKKLNKCVEIAQSLGIHIDEDDKGCKDGKKLAKEVMQQVTSISDHEAKLKMLPLQGPELWHKWATLDKETYRQLSRNKNIDVYSKDMEDKKTAVRQKQFNLIVKPTSAMREFSSNLLMHTGNVRLYFLHWLKMLLDDHSREVLPKLNDAYQKTRAELLKAKAQNKNHQEDSEDVKKLKNQLKLQNEQLVNASFGLEHFFREMGQIYEARMDDQHKSVLDGLQGVFSYPEVVADLMGEGYPVELMDGDAAHVPITWALAVINKLKDKHLLNQKIFVISVLGIQSTGKSTLLNTTFGLRFNVSAGRCTRGAYFQLLPFNSELRKESGCGHILIVDTEGLRAPELQYKESQRHDNELATFVIGLADLTIINIYGETPGELTDILQTSVHAFIRMKNVDMQMSCHFVHQNVTAVMADSKSKVGRQNFQDRLDLMTNSAAKIEKCEGRYRSFQDVIQFDEERDVTLFPSLWKGDPPMAPVNPGYSSKACTLKESIITTIKGKQGKCDFASFQLRVERLWSAVLQEKFVFSFKNTLEVTAYNELDTKYSQWSWKLQHQLLDWKREAKNPFISSGDVSESALDGVEKSCLLKIEQNLNNMHEVLGKELVEFFEKSERSETLTQWRKSTEVRLKNLCDEYKDEAKKHCKVLRQNREGRVKIDYITQSYRQQLQAEIIRLASDTKKSALTEKKRQEIFNMKWQEWIAELSKSIEPVAYASENHMELVITGILNETYYTHAQLITEGLKLQPLSQRGTLKLDIVRLHLDSTKWKSCLGKHAKNLRNVVMRTGEHEKYADASEEDYSLAREQTQKFFHMVEEWVQEIMESCQDFNKSSVTNLLMKLQNSVGEFNDGKVVKSNFTFTPHYQVDIAITVAGYAYQKFVEKMQQLAIENDPIESMKRLKPVFYRTFETQFSNASNDQTAAQNLCNILRKSIEKALLEKLQVEVVDKMKDEDSHFSKKKHFKVLIMKELAAAKKFKLYKVYLKDVTESFKYWSKVFVKRHCEMKITNGNTKLYDLAEVNLKILISKIEKEIKITSNLPENFEIAHTKSTISGKHPEDSSQYSDVNKWLNNFHKEVKTHIPVDLQEIKEMVGVKSIHQLIFFTGQLLKYLKNESEAILSDFKKTDASIAKLTTESPNSPHMLLCNSLIGCTKQCPFCKEQCEITDENHVKSNPHYTEIHRPQCLGKFTHKKDGKLVFKLCTEDIEGTSSFRNADTDNEYHPYKDYKGIYPDWLISTESPKTGPKYWEWFIAKYNSDLVAWIKANPSPVEDQGWQNITEEDAINNLYTTYKLNIK